MRALATPGGGTGKCSGDGRRRYFMVSNSFPEQTTARLFAALQAGLIEHGHAAELDVRVLPSGIVPKLRYLARFEWRNLPRVRHSDVFVTHSPASLSVVTSLLARLLGKRVMTFVWDVYPESTKVAGTPLGRIWLTGYWLAERLGFLLSHAIVISSEDYRPLLRRWDRWLLVMPLWPCDPVRPIRAGAPAVDPVLRLAFAGQVNSIRGLDTGVGEILRLWTGECVELHVFSADSCPAPLQALAAVDPRFRLVEHGFVEADRLPGHLADLDIGLSCLDPGFALPAFPSKVMAYVGAGLPVLYSGPRLGALEDLLQCHSLGLSTGSLDRLTPQDVVELRVRFAASRDEFLADMADRWFELEAPRG
jgi:hypothetical protein